MSITISKVSQYSYNVGSWGTASGKGYWYSNNNAWDTAGSGGSQVGYNSNSQILGHNACILKIKINNTESSGYSSCNGTISIDSNFVKKHSSNSILTAYIFDGDYIDTLLQSTEVKFLVSSNGQRTTKPTPYDTNYYGSASYTCSGSSSTGSRPITDFNISVSNMDLSNGKTYCILFVADNFLANLAYNQAWSLTALNIDQQLFEIHYDLNNTPSNEIQCTGSYTIQGTSNHVYYNGSIYTAKINTSGGTHTVLDLEDDFKIIRPGYDCTSYKTSWGVTVYPGTGYTRNKFTNEQDKDYAYLTAKWTPQIYTIILDQHFVSGIKQTYYLKYGVGWYSDAACTNSISEITQTMATGHSLRGYFTGTNGSGTKIIDSDLSFLSNTFTTTNETTLHAKWDPNTYTITLNRQSGSGGDSAVYLKYNTGWYSNAAATTSTTSIDTPTRTNYDFGGYYTKENGEGTQIIDSDGDIIAGKKAFSADVTVYAYWKQNTTSTNIKYRFNGSPTHDTLGLKIDENKGYKFTNYQTIATKNDTDTTGSIIQTIENTDSAKLTVLHPKTFGAYCPGYTFNSYVLWGNYGYEPGEEISGSFFNGYSTVYLIANANCWIENTLELNTPLELELPFENTEAYAKFIPNTTGTYIFTSQDADGIDPTGTLYSSEDLNTQLAYDDDGNGQPNFKLSCDLEANKTYYIKLRAYYNTAGKAKILVSRPSSYTVTLNIGQGNGTVTGQGSYSANTTATITATPSAGYVFSHWLDNDTNEKLTNSSFSFTVTEDKTFSAYFVPQTYTITFDINGGSGNVPADISKTGTSSSVVMGRLGSAVPTKTGYNFRGWSSTSTYNQKRVVYSNSSSYGGGADYNGISPTAAQTSWTFQKYLNDTDASTTTGTTLTLYAQWELKKYAITYYQNAGNTTDKFLEEYKDYGIAYYITDETPTREGYKFLGWSTSSTATTPMAAYAAGRPYSGNLAKDLYAVWKKTYTITTQIALGSGTISSGDIYETGTSITLTASPSLGYQFDMWMDEDGTEYNSSTLNITVTENKIFSAYFSPIQYSITFNANGGSGNMSNGTKFYNVDYDLPQSDFTPPNKTNNYTITCYYNDGTGRYEDKTCTRTTSYSFKQWRLGSSEGTAYQVGDPYTANSSATFYADWKTGSTTGTIVLGSVPRDNKEIRRTVTFNPNGGTTTPANQIYTETTSYTFNGWSKSNSATTASYSTTGSYGFLSPTTLYGVWGETQTSSDPLVLPKISRSTTRQTIQHTFKPEATGLSTTLRTKVIITKYELTGWTDETNNKLNLSNTYIPTNESTTLTADWSQSETITGNYTAPTLSRAGYQLLGWSYQSSSSPSQEIAYAPGDEITDETGQTFYAVWAQDIFLITLDHQTGNSSINNLKFQYSVGWFDIDDNQLTSINIPTKTGYIFQGYYTDDNSLIITNTGALSDNKTWTNENTTLYAHWTPITYFVLYNTSPYLENSAIPVNYDSVHTTKNAISRTHTITYEKNGGSGGVQQHTSTIHSSYWVDNNNTRIPNNKEIKNLTTTNGDIIELKPHWELNVITLPTLTQSGYNFLGWYDSNGVKIGNGGASYTISKDITLYAHWDPIGLVQIRYNGQWRKAIPYVYDGSEWKRAITSIQTSEDPNNPVWQTGVNYGQHKLIN